MKIEAIHIRNVKSVSDSGLIELSPCMNVVLGPNNSGKSILINSLYLLQQDSLQPTVDIRLGETTAEVSCRLIVTSTELATLVSTTESGELHVTIRTLLGGQMGAPRRELTGSLQANVGPFPSIEPRNVIYPFLSKRKVTGYDEVVDSNRTKQVTSNFQYLVSKIDRLSSPGYRHFEEFRQACIDVIGFPVDTIASANGHKIGLHIGDTEAIFLEAMGDGIPHLLALIADLCIATNKVFLLEEVEHDLHPKALKSLLDLIVRKSSTNQFVVTTHSNIVARYLGSIQCSRMFKVTVDRNKDLPRTEYAVVSEDPEERRAVLEDLGYDLPDSGLWKGWLILEESSAERIIRDALIPTFAPGLSQALRTVSAAGVDRVEATFDALDRHFLFTHLTPIYRNRVWVVVDAGAGDAVVHRLQDRYQPSGWHASQFMTFTQTDFERYYPARFRTAVDQALSFKPAADRRKAKRALLEKVLAWISEEPEAAKADFSVSAPEVIGILKEIERVLESCGITEVLV